MFGTGRRIEGRSGSLNWCPQSWRYSPQYLRLILTVVAVFLLLLTQPLLGENEESPTFDYPHVHRVGAMVWDTTARRAGKQTSAGLAQEARLIRQQAFGNSLRTKVRSQHVETAGQVGRSLPPHSAVNVNSVFASPYRTVAFQEPAAAPPVPSFEPVTTMITVPLEAANERIRITTIQDKINLQALDAPVNEVLAMIARQHGLNIVAGQNVTGTISVTFKGLELEEALQAVLAINGYTWTRRKNVVFVSKVSADSKISSRVQGRISQVFSLHYVSAEDVQTVVTPLLSPIGSSVVTSSTPTDQRRSGERIIVEDLPEYLEPIAARIAEIDQPPMQVLIEAHILQVTLNDELRHGVDFAALARISNSAVVGSSPAFTIPSAALNTNTSPEYNLSIIGSDLAAVLEALQSQTDTKTLASPRLLVVNGQEAKIQIGDKLGYFVTTTTQTSTLQEVKFLETGVVLRVTPIMGADGRIMMTVSPEISSGRVVPETGLPEETTTEVQTTIILEDGQAMVVGGLITEADEESQTKIPIVGDLWGVGRFLQKRTVRRNRSEIIIALVPRVMPFGEDYKGQAELDAVRATTPLLDHHLQPIIRPEPDVEFPDAMENPRSIRLDRLMRGVKDISLPRPRPLGYYFPTISGPGWFADADE